MARLRATWLRLPRWARRAGSGVAGVTLIAAGAALLVLPGPGLVVIALGLGVLATEFERPRRLLRGVTERVREAAQRARSRA